REYERLTTTVANAFVQPITARYVDDLQRRLHQAGYRGRLFLMLSSGGISTGETAKEFPVRLAESGPAAGVLAAAYFSRWAGLDAVISFDMGGTTAKIGVVHRDQPHMANMMEVARVQRFKRGSGIPIKIPVIEMIEIGAGGGSIAHIDRLGLLKVGPRSAGADPGPACYGFGGTEPTVTDANLVLGYLDPGYFLGGTMRLDTDAARDAVATRVAKPLDLDLVRAARGIYEVVNENMLSAMKVHIAERGEDPRQFYLFAFGGAAPAHAYELARTLKMRGVIVPPGAGATSAMGMVTTAASFEFARSFYTRLDRLTWEELDGIFGAMEAEGIRVLRDAAVDPAARRVVRQMDLRHRGQGHELNVEIPEEVWTRRSLDDIARHFHARYAEKYGHAYTDLAVELITCRMVVAGPAPHVPLQIQETGGSLADALKGRRPVYFVEDGGYVETPVYDRYRLAAGTAFGGPAIVEERECTIVVGPSSRARVDAHGFLFMDLNT
ncbi:MAG: hydantoinase/oxoprolinase family protein, partial [Armatimonadetes bacterium]|nr:hydantoinase/oxoprolinase family protein [Armatimonadota bacterium]